MDGGLLPPTPPTDHEGLCHTSRKDNGVRQYWCFYQYCRSTTEFTHNTTGVCEINAPPEKKTRETRSLKNAQIRGWIKASAAKLQDKDEVMPVVIKCSVDQRIILPSYQNFA